MILETGQI